MMQKSSRFSKEEFKCLRQKCDAQLEQQRKQAWSDWSQQYNTKPWARPTEVNLNVRSTPDTIFGLRYGYITNMPQEFKDAIQDSIPEESCKKAQQLLVHIIAEYYNIPEEVQTVYQKVIEESKEIGTSKSHIIRCIVWKHYGHEPPEQSRWYLKRCNKKKTLEQFKQECELLQDKKGIEKYYTPDPENLIDQEILRQIRLNGISLSAEERKCRKILTKRLSLGCDKSRNNYTKVDAEILSGIKNRCSRHKKGWNETVRELFCIEFNIKTNINLAQEINT